MHLGAIRLAWWRERLEDLHQGKTPAEPRLQAVAGELLPRGVTGRELSGLEDAWLPLLEGFPWGEAQAGALKRRGHLLFGIGARLIGGEASAVEAAGALWSLADAAAHCSDPDSRALLRHEAQRVLGGITTAITSKLRPLTMPAALAAADVMHARSNLARAKAAVLHRMMGRFPRS